MVRKFWPAASRNGDRSKRSNRLPRSGSRRDLDEAWCLYVTIIPDGSRLGHVCCEDPLIRGHNYRIEHALKVLIAANLAEGKHTGSRDIWGDADDRVMATKIALLATDRDTKRAEALINEMIGETCKLVEQHWPDIEALAQRLLVKGRVNFLGIEAGASETSGKAEYPDRPDVVIKNTNAVR